jgi:PAS domain S-box-containing protein
MDFTQRLLETCPDCIYVFDLVARRSIYRNRKLHETLGYEDAELDFAQAVIPQQLMHPEDTQDIELLMARLRALGAGQVDKLEFRLREKGGRWRHFCSRVTSLGRNARGETTQILGMISDVSARKWAEVSAEEALAAAERVSATKSQFLAQMSHEIRTPLAGIIGAASLLQTTGMTDEQKDYVDTIGRTADALQGIVDDVLDYSKIEAGKLELNSHPFRLTDLLEDSLRGVAESAAAKGLALYSELQPRLPAELMGDAARIRQILCNFLANAVKFTRQGEIRLAVEELRRDGPRCLMRFSVSDTCVGIAEAAGATLFHKYTQTAAAIAGCYGGTGLGLAISRQLAELMGGRVGFTSRLGEGAKFWLELDLDVAGLIFDARAFPDDAWQGLVVHVLSDHQGSGEALRSLCAAGGARVSLTRVESEVLPELPKDPEAVLIIDCQHKHSPLSRAEALPCLAEAPGRKVLITPFEPAFPVKTAAARDHGFALCLPQPASLRRLVAFLSTGGDLPSPKLEPGGEDTLPAGHQVLIVDDNADNRAILSKMVERAGCSSRFAATGREAVEAVRTERPSLVFMDCQMPDMDGYDATRAIRALAEGHGLAIIGLTANVLGSRRADCLDAGMDEVLSKPVRLGEIKRQLSRWLPREAGRDLPTRKEA